MKARKPPKNKPPIPRQCYICGNILERAYLPYCARTIDSACANALYSFSDTRYANKYIEDDRKFFLMLLHSGDVA